MIKSVGKILFICLILLIVSCQTDQIDTIDYNVDVLSLYEEEINLFFGNIKILRKSRLSDTYRSYTLTRTINYDVWEIEYLNDNQEINYTELKNRYDFKSSIGEIIYHEITEDVIDELALEQDSVINFENGFDGYESLDDIDLRYYPVNLRLDELPDDLLIVISPREDKVKEFNETLTEVIEKINRAEIKNVLLLYGNDAYQLDHGILVVDGEVKYEKISVEDTLKWIESNR